MKIIPYIFILLLTSAFTLPKADLCLAEETSTHACCSGDQNSTAGDHHCSGHEAPAPEEEGGCSSSCHCLCCAVAFIPLGDLPRLKDWALKDQSPSFLFSDHLFDFPSRVWQPPRRN